MQLKMEVFIKIGERWSKRDNLSTEKEKRRTKKIDLEKNYLNSYCCEAIKRILNYTKTLF